MKFKNIKDSMMALLEDAGEAETFLDNNADSQFARRTYIRSIFACLEGAIFIFKNVCLNAKPTSDKKVMTVAEFALLREETYELKNNGEVATNSKFLRLQDNLKFTFKTIDRMFRTEIDLGIGKEPWHEFMQAIEIRNRITHPRLKSAFTITDREIEICKKTSGWFNDITHKAMVAMLESARHLNSTKD